MDEFIDGLAALQARYVTEVIKLADKHNIDRDNAVLKSAHIFLAMAELTTAELTTFENFVYEEGAENE